MDTEIPTIYKEDAPLIASTAAAASKSRPKKQARPKSRTKNHHQSHPRNVRGIYNSAESSDDVIVVHSSSDLSEFDFNNTLDEKPQPHYQRDRDEAKNNQLLATLETISHTVDEGASMLSIFNHSSSLAATRDDEGSGEVFSISHPPQTNGLLSVASLPECLVNELNDEAIVIAREENPFISREKDPVIITEIREDEKQMEEDGEKGLKDDSSQPGILEISCETLVGKREDTLVISSVTATSEGSKDQALENDFTSAALATEEAPLINDICSKPVTKVTDGECGEDPKMNTNGDIGEPVEVEGASLTSRENPVISEENIHGNKEEPIEAESIAVHVHIAGGEDPVINKKIQGNREESESTSLGGGEDSVISSKVEPVSFVVGGSSGMEPAISGAEVNSEMEAEAADNLSVSKEGNDARREGQEDVPLISDGTTSSHISSLDGGDGTQRIDQSALSSMDEDIQDTADEASTEPSSISHSQCEDIPVIKEGHALNSVAADDATLPKDTVAAASSEDTPLIKDNREKNGPEFSSQNEVESASEFLPIEPDPIIKVSDKEGKIWDILLTSTCTAMSSQIVTATSQEPAKDLETAESSASLPSPSLSPERDTTPTKQVQTPADGLPLSKKGDACSVSPPASDQEGTDDSKSYPSVVIITEGTEGGAPLIKDVSPRASGRERMDDSERCPDEVTIVESVEGGVPLIKEISTLAPEQEDTEISNNYCPSPSSLPTEEDAPLIFFSDENECSHIHPCPLLPDNLSSPLVSEWDAPLNSTANESFDNLPSPLLSTAGEISLTFITDESFVNHQNPLPPEEGTTPTISTTNESSENILLVEGDVPQISTTNESSGNSFKGDTPSISSITGSSEDLLQLKGDISAISSIQGGAPISIDGESLENFSPFQGDAPSISSIEVNFDETSLPVFQLEDSDSDSQETTETYTETTSLSSVSEEDGRGQRSSSPHGDRCITTAPPNKQVSPSTQLVQSLTTGDLDAAPPCSVEIEGGLQSDDCCNSCQLSDLSQRENHEEEDNKSNKKNNSIPQLVNIAQTPAELGQEFDKNMCGIRSPHSSLSPSPSPSPSPTPSHPHPSLPSAAQAVALTTDTDATQVAASDDCPSSSSTNQGESLALVCV